MRSKKYYLFLIYFFLKKGQRKDSMKLNYFTYFCSRCCKWSHIKVPNYFFHSNALFCCVFSVHFDPLAFESYFSCPRAVLSSRSSLVRCSLHAELISTTYIFNSNCFIPIHRLRMLKGEVENRTVFL